MKERAYYRLESLRSEAGPPKWDTVAGYDHIPTLEEARVETERLRRSKRYPKVRICRIQMLETVVEEPG